MEPMQVASRLNQIADAIDSSKSPRRDLVAQEISDLISRVSKKKKKKTPKSQKRGDCVFPHTSKKVKDNKDHFPINSESQARNALSRANQYDKSPPWYDGSLKDLVSAVARKVHSKYPDIEVSEASKKPGKGKGKGKKKKSSMTPNEVSYVIRQIATAIDNSSNPRRELVAEDLQKVIAGVVEDVGYDPINPPSTGPSDMEWHEFLTSGKHMDVFQKWLQEDPGNLDHLFFMVLSTMEEGETVPKEVRELALRGTLDPPQVASKLRQIAAAIDNSKNPRKDLVLRDIRRLAILLEEEGMKEQPVVEQGCMSCGEKGGHAPGCLYERSMREHQEKQSPPDYSM